MAWYLKGETGKTLDATLRELSSLRIDSCALRFQSLADDTLTWSAATENATGAGTIIPDVGQVVELWKDGARKFRGHVTMPRVGSKRITVTAVGPWWWLTRIPLTSSQTDSTGVSAERANFVFSTGAHKTKIESLIARAIANGAPMVAGTVVTIYDTPNMSLAEMNCGQALAELMAWVPDGVTWFDYSGTGLPALHVGRRSGFAATTYAIGTDAVIDTDLSPRLDLEVARVGLDFVTRTATTGRPAWASQAAGTSTAGKNQIITVSGPEISELLPKDDFDSYQIQTISATLTNAVIIARDSGLASVNAQFGTPPGGLFSFIDRWIGWSKSSSTYNPVGFPAQIRLRTNGTTAPSTGYNIISSLSPPDWAISQLGAYEITIIGTWGCFWLYPNGTTPAPSAAFEATAQTTYTHGWASPPSSSDTGLILIGSRQYQVKVWVYAGTAYPALTTIYKAWDYNFLTPPAGLATGLLAAQNWVPWEGTISLVADDVSGDNLLNAKYNVTGTISPCASMQTLARGVSHDITNGRTTIELGAPARTDFGTLTSRIRRQPRDNIVYL